MGRAIAWLLGQPKHQEKLQLNMRAMQKPRNKKRRSESEEQQEDQDETLTMAREEARMCEHFTRLALSYKSAYPEESTQELNQAMVSKHAHVANWHADAEKHIMTYYDLKVGL